MLVRATRPLRLECIARGYLFGSAWSEYEERGTVCGGRCPPGLRQAERLPEPIFTSTTKAEAGHDLPLTDAEAADARRRRRVRAGRGPRRSRSTASRPRTPRRCGLLLADTKLEFGTVDGELLVIDEMLHARLVALLAGRGLRGRLVAAVVRQAVRARLLPRSSGGTSGRRRRRCRASVINGTRARYVEAYELLTDTSFDEWYGVDE